VEKVHVDKFPGGQFTVDAQNGINLLGGSGGIDFSSTGTMSIHGTIAEITGEQVNISSKSGMNIATEDVLSIKSPNIAIQADNQIFVKPNLAVNGNIVCSGGIMSQGELFVQHVTAPMSLQETEFQSELYGTAYQYKALKIGYIAVGTIFDALINNEEKVVEIINAPVPVVTMDSGQIADDGCIYVYPHQHLFRNLPLTLTPTYEAMRGNASGIDGGSPIASGKVENGITCPEVKGTTKEASVGLENQLKSKDFTPIEIES